MPAPIWRVIHVRVPFTNGDRIAEDRLLDAIAPYLEEGWEPFQVYADAASVLTWPATHIHAWLRRREP